MSTPSLPPSGDYSPRPFKDLADYYNHRVPLYEEKVKDAQSQLDQMKAA